MTLDFKPGYCARCQNAGIVECYCGGDLCVCGAGEIPCPECGGESGYFDADIGAEKEKG
jgi:hypothetical protein